jgi:GH18 family chitinase
MARPQAYDPQEGYKYQILTRNPAYGRAWEQCDYAKDKEEKNHLLGEYRMAYGAGWEFKVITLPVKYWPKRSSVPLMVSHIVCATFSNL